MSEPYGIMLDQPIGHYHQNDAWSNSKLQVWRRSRLKAFQLFVAKTRKPDKSKGYQVLGNAVHCAVLEGPTVFASRYVLSPYDNYRTAAAQGWRADQELAGKIPLTKEEAEVMAACVSSVKSDPLASALLSAGRPEVTFRKKLPRFDVQCRVDWWNEEGVQLPTGRGDPEFTGSYFLELKTITTADETGGDKDIWEMFRGHFRKYAYYQQAAWNREVIAELQTAAGKDQVRPAMYYLVVQTDEPYDCIVCQPSARALAVATTEIRAELERIDGCYRSGIWNGIYEVELPYSYEQKQLAEARKQHQIWG